MTTHTHFADVISQTHTNVAPEGHHHTREGWINFDCPFCGAGTRSYHMGYNKSGRYLNCWRCGRHGVIETLVALGVDHKAAKAVYGSLEVDNDWVKPVRHNLKLPKAGDLKPAHRKYLRKRGFDPDEIVRLWEVQGIAMHPTLSWRILIPIHLGDEIVSWTTRAIRPVSMRYRSAGADEEAVNHKDLLYGEHYLGHTAIVHEGPLDVWATGPGAVGTCGTGVSRAQILRLSKYPVRVICFDSSAQAQKRAKQLCNELDVYDGETYNVMLETGDDPAEADRDEIEELRRTFL